MLAWFDVFVACSCFAVVVVLMLVYVYLLRACMVSLLHFFCCCACVRVVSVCFDCRRVVAAVVFLVCLFGVCVRVLHGCSEIVSLCACGVVMCFGLFVCGCCCCV